MLGQILGQLWKELSYRHLAKIRTHFLKVSMDSASQYGHILDTSFHSFLFLVARSMVPGNLFVLWSRNLRKKTGVPFPFVMTASAISRLPLLWRELYKYICIRGSRKSDVKSQANVPSDRVSASFSLWPRVCEFTFLSLSVLLSKMVTMVKTCFR